MKIKRFFATDMRQAIRLVREEQGSDAVILSSRRVEGGIEIVSAVDYDQDLIAEMLVDDDLRQVGPRRMKVPQCNREESGTAIVPEPAPDPTPRHAATGPKNILWAQDPAIVEMRRELAGMRDLLQDQIEQLSWANIERNDPVKAQVYKRFDRVGISRDLAEVIIDSVHNLSDIDRAWRAALYGLVQRIPVCETEVIDQGGVVALVGPTGVGKTTTIAKIAARFALRHGRQNLALVTTDTYRVGAHKQLATFGQILGVPVHLAQSGQELGDLLREFSGKQLVLIDTAGMSQRDVCLAEQFEALMGVPRLRSYLVLSANIQRAALDEAVRRFSRLKLSGCVLTKLDEAASLGDALSAVIRNGLPLAYVSDGQRVPDDLAAARSTHLVSRAVALAGAEDPQAEEATHAPAQITKQNRMTAHAARIA